MEDRQDLIQRQAVLDAFDCSISGVPVESVKYVSEYADKMMSRINALPSVEPEIKPIEYRYCAYAMLRMWMDKVVTDSEYKRIMDKLNAHWEVDDG